MVIVLLIIYFTDAMPKDLICSNFLHDRSLKGPIVDVKLDNNKVSWLAYAAYNIYGMRGLSKIVRDWGIIKMQPARVLCQTYFDTFKCDTTCLLAQSLEH